MRFHINHVWTNVPLLIQVSDPQWKVAASRSNFCLIPAFHLGGRRDTLRGDGTPVSVGQNTNGSWGNGGG